MGPARDALKKKMPHSYWHPIFWQKHSFLIKYQCDFCKQLKCCRPYNESVRVDRTGLTVQGEKNGPEERSSETVQWVRWG